jgi:nucleoside phosphorylase
MNMLRLNLDMGSRCLRDDVERALDRMDGCRRGEYERPPAADDVLYRSDHVHAGEPGQDCKETCGRDPLHTVARAAVRADDDDDDDDNDDGPAIHYGVVASGNTVVRDALLRDRLAAEHDVLCFESEAAGIMDHFPCAVVRGVAGYADSHTTTAWHGCASMAAAAYARALLDTVLPSRAEYERAAAAAAVAARRADSALGC